MLTERKPKLAGVEVDTVRDDALRRGHRTGFVVDPPRLEPITREADDPCLRVVQRAADFLRPSLARLDVLIGDKWVGRLNCALEETFERDGHILGILATP